MILDTAQDKFVSSLKEKLVKAGEKNVSIKDSSDESRSKAMENIAEAFLDPVKTFIDEESTGGTAGSPVVSLDRTVSIKPFLDPIQKRLLFDLSVRSILEGLVTDVRYEVNESGGGGALKKTVDGADVSVLEFMTTAEAQQLFADAKAEVINQ